MKAKYQVLFDEFMLALAEDSQADLPESDIITNQFWTANKFWDLLKTIMLPFTDDLDEIQFFKQVKPTFTSYIEYFTILSEAILSVDKMDVDPLHFWQEEEKRYRTFTDRHRDFIDYMESGSLKLDTQYFLQRNTKVLSSSSGLYDAEPAYSASYDHLVRSYLARKRYCVYCLSKIAILNDNKKI